MLTPDNLLNIVIADDHPIVIEGLEKLLQTEPAFCVKASFTSCAGLMSYLKKNIVDIVLLDIGLPDGNGIQVCKEIIKKNSDIKVIAISNLNEPSIIMQMMQNGAAGYLLKTAAAKDIVNCIWKAVNGEQALSIEIKEILLQGAAAINNEIPDLTKREKQILSFLAQGLSTAEIAATLFISPLTVKTHRATLLQKFGVSNIVPLINRAKQFGML